MVWKVEGLSDYDARRPLTPTGTNLLGLIKHLASVELGYFGDTFGRPSGIALPWHDEDADPNDDLYLTADESREWVLDLYRTAWAHAAVTFEQSELDTVGRVPWWGDERRGDAAPDPRAHGRGDPPARRPRRHRPRDHRRPGRPVRH